jgi:hypothetical protein
MIPGFSNYNQEQTVIQTVNNVRNDLVTQINKSESGVNAHWYGISFEAKNAASPINPNSYHSFEMTPRDTAGALICPITIFSINTIPCSTSTYKKVTSKNYLKGVYLDKIIRIDSSGADIDTPSSIDVRFNQSPKSGQIALSTASDDSAISATVARVELIFKNGTHQRSLVIDGGNICDKGDVEENLKCGGVKTGGPRSGKVFVVNRE